MVKTAGTPPTSVCAAAASLGQIGAGAQGAIPALIKGLKSKFVSVQWAAAQALTQMGDSAVPALQKISKDEETKTLVAFALGQIEVAKKPPTPKK